MAIDEIELAGATSRIWRVWIADSSSTTGAGLAGVTFASLNAYYHSASTTAAVLITLATMSTMNGYTSGGFLAIDGTNMPGVYAFCPPNAVIATGPSATVILKGAASMAPKTIHCQIVAYDPYTAPATAPTNWSSLSITAAGRVDVAAVSGTTQTARDLGASVLLSSGTGTGQVSLSSGLVSLSGTQTANITGNITGNLSGSVGSVTGAVASVTGNVGGNVVGSVASVTATVNADVKKLNGTTLNGDGSATPWGP